ncbi:MAG: hypothetical protein IKQ66_04220 [Treponema sp.]|nr:hypothetical protein [Treponema sp.]
MKDNVQNMVSRFLRTYADKFTLRDVVKFFSSLGVKISSHECQAYLESSPYVFALEDGFYITRAGAFTGEIFSIRPSAREFEQRVLVPGSRCMPFVDSEMLPSALSFYIDGKRIQKRVGTFDCDSAIDFYQLYGEEYAPQYIASDPANSSLDMVARDYELPNNVMLTGLDMGVLIDDFGMQLGDRIMCSVTNWDKGIIHVMVVRDGKNKFNRGFEGSAKILWYTNLEKALLESFDRFGPCESIEEQLANVFFENTEDLCYSMCGSIEEYLNGYASKVGMQRFGVETRLWFKGQSVPCFGEWNRMMDEFGMDTAWFPYILSQDVVEQVLTDMVARRDSDFEQLLKKMYPSDYVFHKDEKNSILEMVKDWYVAIRESYNWFADRSIGDIRRQALELFVEVKDYVYKINEIGMDACGFPQQELVILTQLSGHLYGIMGMLKNIDSVERESESILMSIDGMRWNFEDIRGILDSALEEHRVSQFKVVRGAPSGKVGAKKIK